METLVRIVSANLRGQEPGEWGIKHRAGKGEQAVVNGALSELREIEEKEKESGEQGRS